MWRCPEPAPAPNPPAAAAARAGQLPPRFALRLPPLPARLGSARRQMPPGQRSPGGAQRSAACRRTTGRRFLWKSDGGSRQHCCRFRSLPSAHCVLCSHTRPIRINPAQPHALFGTKSSLPTTAKGCSNPPSGAAASACRSAGASHSDQAPPADGRKRRAGFRQTHRVRAPGTVAGWCLLGSIPSCPPEPTPKAYPSSQPHLAHTQPARPAGQPAPRPPRRWRGGQHPVTACKGRERGGF